MDSTTFFAWTAIFGVLTGFRSMLPMAMLCGFAWRQGVPLTGRWSFFGHLTVFLIFSVLAALEVAGDKWKGAPNRTAPLGLAGRFFMGGLCGAILAANTYFAWWKGAAICALMAIFGAALGYSLRQYFAESSRGNDFFVAVAEDVITFAGSFWVLYHMA